MMIGIPLKITGYGVSGNHEASERVYYLNNDILIASAVVMRYEGSQSADIVGFLFDGKLYRDIRDLDTAVFGMATEKIIAALHEIWGTK